MLNGQENVFDLIKKFPTAKEVFKKLGVKLNKTRDQKLKIAALAIEHKIPLRLLLNHLAKSTGLEVVWPKVQGLENKKNSFGASTGLRTGKIPGVKKFIAIHSGKGGVGKTFVAVNLALYLAGQGLKVGLLDLDIDCPNVMKVLNLKGKLFANKEKRIVPLEKFKLKIISMAGIQENAAQAILWRGPIIAKATEQLLYDTDWGELDVLIADLPPGTGDIPITLLNLLKLDGVIFVTTPQELALLDAMKSLDMCKSFGVKSLGVIENMTGEIFGKPQAEKIFKEKQVFYLGNIPLEKKFTVGNYKFLLKDQHLKNIFHKIKKLLNFG